MKRLALILLFTGCGRAALLDEPVVASAPIVAAAPKCEVDPELSTSKWRCDTVAALEIVSLDVTNADGSRPWTTGQPRVTTLLRNKSGAFLNYPGVQLTVTGSSLQPRSASDCLYGLNGCEQMQMEMQLNSAAPSGTAVTFTARPVHINGDDCALVQPFVTVTVTAP